MERFTVSLNVETDKNTQEFTHKFEEMKNAKLFALRVIQKPEHKDSSVEIFDNRANQRVYYHFQVDGKSIHSNLVRSTSTSVSSQWRD